jgi:hypothetical protein
MVVGTDIDHQAIITFVDNDKKIQKVPEFFCIVPLLNIRYIGENEFYKLYFIRYSIKEKIY